MKKICILACILLLISCGGYNSINSFYNSHKNDTHVTALQVPQFMLALLRGASDEQDNFIGNIRDIRYITLTPQTESEKTLINEQINSLVSNRFVEVFRKNDEDKRTLISVRENREVVKEIIIYKNSNNNNTVFYLNGNFDPQQVRNFAKEGKLDDLSNNILQQSNLNPSKNSN